MKPIKIEQENLIEAIKNGNPYIQIENKKYVLMEINEGSNDDFYIVSDPTEEKKLLEALNHSNPILSEEEINEMLRR